MVNNLNSCLGKADIHIHTTGSDGKDSYKSIVDYVVQNTDLDIIAITDHDSVKCSLEALAYAKEKGYKIDVITGTEISSREGHILALYIDKDIPPDLSCEETVKRVHELGGVAIAAHVFLRGSDKKKNRVFKIKGLKKEDIAKSGFDGIEVLNGVPSLYFRNKKAKKANELFFKLPVTAGSDAHVKESIGICYTLFEGKTKEEFRQSLMEGTTYADGRVWYRRDVVSYLKFKWHSTTDKKGLIRDILKPKNSKKP